MKKIICLLCVITLISCNKKEAMVKEETESIIDLKNPLNKLQYANKIDFYCKMDLAKFGVSDTVTYNGQLYGFCSTMCKHEFLMKPEEYLTKK